MIGEIRATAEEEAAEFLKKSKIKNLQLDLFAGLTAPQAEEWDTQER